jgi:hypothetical protein
VLPGWAVVVVVLFPFPTVCGYSASRPRTCRHKPPNSQNIRSKKVAYNTTLYDFISASARNTFPKNPRRKAGKTVLCPPKDIKSSYFTLKTEQRLQNQQLCRQSRVTTCYGDSSTSRIQINALFGHGTMAVHITWVELSSPIISDCQARQAFL